MALEAQVSNWTDVLSATFSRSIDAHLVIILTHSSESLKHGIHLWWTGGGGPTSLPPPCEMGVARQLAVPQTSHDACSKFCSFANFVKEIAFPKVKCEYVVSGVQGVQLTRAFCKMKTWITKRPFVMYMSPKIRASTWYLIITTNERKHVLSANVVRI